VLEGRPTKIQKSEIQPLFAQAKSYGLAQQSKKNKAAGEEFLARNAKEPGIKVLPDGLQYRVLQEGTGRIPGTNDQVYVKFRGTFVDGRQFLRHNHYLIRCGGGCPGWQEALPRMRIGSKWQIFVPSALGFGSEGEPAWGVGAEATLIFELEMLSIAPPNAEFGRGRLGHAFEDSDVPEPQPQK
jgi:FKBP-type peptidyl-prolyl cis-trans isomerase